MRAILGCALAVTLVVCAGAAAKDEKIDAKKLVGKWEPKEKKEGASFVIEFTKDGKVTISVNAKEKEAKFEGTYKVDGNKVTTAIKFGEKEQKETHTIIKLTDTELVSKDEKGKEETLLRIKSK
ncbi:MAG: TIGR03066 family protein [Planctomycetes bacterium]|nr:TIGR03066 family protein [Planctomycetota bacterium]